MLARMLSQSDLTVSTLGKPRFRSPLPMSTVAGDGVGDFVDDRVRVLYEVSYCEGQSVSDLGFEAAGPRQQIFFDPPKTRAAIVTCGGLCPGINNIIRTLFFDLTVNYGIAEVLGVRYGYQGLNAEVGKPPVRLTRETVEGIHHYGGTILGTSRGAHDVRVMVDFLEQAKIDILFCVGGDGTQKGSHAIAGEIGRRKLRIAVVGLPKTIDNDIQFCSRTFGYATAVAEADIVIDRAHTEALGVLNGIGLVKLMGREAGFIAAAATIASGHVNFTFIPEVPVRLEGEDGLLAKLERRLAARGHAVIVVAEGAGQNLIPQHKEAYDASGNRLLGDIGAFLKREITEHFTRNKLPVQVRYFDPSYLIRSCPANTDDSLLCERLARSAAHAAMAGKTDVLIGLWHDKFVHLPLSISAGQKKRLSPEDECWTTVLAMTAQEKW
jgi:6-phosphofructokinase 1